MNKHDATSKGAQEGETDPPARGKLAAALADRGWSQGRLAEIIGVSQSSVSSYLRGIIRPEAPIRTLIAQACPEVAEADWLTRAEREAVRAGIRRVRAARGAA